MTVYYLDSSAWVKRYCQEPGSAWIAALFAQNPNLACCALGIVGVTAALSRKAKAGELDAAACAAKLALADSDWSGFTALELTEELLDTGKRAARE
ncbi:MAG: type II toxin-antitoxin system VapC family toxin [Planctomycetes bacterium]|nr:type II toxin-antitoxin system VapC family toxin [Planctomycetota bacterium]